MKKLVSAFELLLARNNDSAVSKTFLCVLCLLCGWNPAVFAQNQKPQIAIIIDDIGDNYEFGLRAVELPGPVACAFLPYTPYSKNLARLAHKRGKEVLLHLPLQAVAHNDLLGPGNLKLHDGEYRFRTTIQKNLAAIPFVDGVNNHMGSLLTRHPGAMDWLMSELKHYGQYNDALFFVDSYTTPKSVALQLANENSVPATRRDVFLDNTVTIASITRQFNHLIKIANRDGHAVAIGHPYPETLQVLEQKLQELGTYGVELVTVQRIIAQRETGRKKSISLTSNQDRDLKNHALTAKDKHARQKDAQTSSQSSQPQPKRTSTQTTQ